MYIGYFAMDALRKLAEIDSHLNVSKAKQILEATWNAKQVEVLDGQGSVVHGGTLVSNAITSDLLLRVEFDIPCAPDTSSFSSCETNIDSYKSALSESPRPFSTTKSVSSIATNLDEMTPSTDAITARFVAALHAQEQKRDFVWAGFIVKELLPSLGLDTLEAQDLFNRLKCEEVIVLTKRPNPNNPDFPSTCVMLNRQNPFVKRVLSRNNRSAKSFRPVPIRGVPASDTLLADRR